MDKTTIYLPRDLHGAIKDIARRSGRPQAELIRDALRAYVAQQERPQPKSFGIVAIKDAVPSSEVDAWLRDNWKPDW